MTVHTLPFVGKEAVKSSSPIHLKLLCVCVLKIFIYLTMPSLSCGTWDLRSLLLPVGSLQPAGIFFFLSCSLWDLVPDQGSNPIPLH